LPVLEAQVSHAGKLATPHCSESWRTLLATGANMQGSDEKFKVPCGSGWMPSKAKSLLSAVGCLGCPRNYLRIAQHQHAGAIRKQGGFPPLKITNNTQKHSSLVH
jgi:hypothetical protein